MDFKRENKSTFCLLSFQVIVLLFLFACHPAKRVPQGQFLLERNTIKSKNLLENLKLDKDELMLIVKQKPNRKMFSLIRFNLMAYNISAGDKVYKKKWKNNFKSWLQNTVGEPPVVADTFLTDKSTRQLELYLKNKGYFHAKVSDTTVYKNRKAYVTYFIDEGRPYTIRNINYLITDSTLAKEIAENLYLSNLKVNENFDVDKLDKERERITKDLKNKGYFYFTKDNLFYTADSALSTQQIDINLKNVDLQKGKDSTGTTKAYLKKYNVNQIIVDLNYDPKHIDNNKRDTIRVKGTTFISNGPLKFKTGIILRSIFFQQGDIYRQSDFDNTYQSFSDLKTFKFINIEFEPDYTYGDLNFINCYIQLLPSGKQNFSVSTDGTNNAGQLGVNGTFTYQNKNVFRGAEIFEFRIKAGVEAQKLLTDTNATKDIGDVVNNTFNTIQIAPSVSLTFPKLLLPFRRDFIPKKFKPQTIFTAGFNFQQRPDFTRKTANLSFAYAFKQNEKISHIVTPSEINFTDNTLTAKTKETIKDNPRLKRSFADVFILSNKYSFIYNGQDFKRNIDFSYLRVNAETGGNILRFINYKGLFSDIIPNKIDTATNAYEFFGNLQLNQDGNAYAQYSKIDVEYRYYHVINANHSLVSRFFGGVAVPYGNSGKTLPFQKSYFSGGSNDIRAWRTLQMGPGNYTENSVTYNRIGDIKLMANSEYRFPIYKYLKGALFVDAGNIWIIYPDPNRTGGEFLPNEFYKQIGVGAGFGLRFDFSFFVIRLDFATKIRDPELDAADAWSFPHLYSKTWKENYTAKYTTGEDLKRNRYQLGTICFGIGYPF